MDDTMVPVTGVMDYKVDTKVTDATTTEGVWEDNLDQLYVSVDPNVIKGFKDPLIPLTICKNL